MSRAGHAGAKARVLIHTFNLMTFPQRGGSLHTFLFPLGDHYMNHTHQISFQNSPLGQLMFPIHIQDRKVAPVVRPGYMESISQYEYNFQAPGWSQVLEPDPRKSGQRINE